MSMSMNLDKYEHELRLKYEHDYSNVSRLDSSRVTVTDRNLILSILSHSLLSLPAMSSVEAITVSDLKKSPNIYCEQNYSVENSK